MWRLSVLCGGFSGKICVRRNIGRVKHFRLLPIACVITTPSRCPSFITNSVSTTMKIPSCGASKAVLIGLAFLILQIVSTMSCVLDSSGTVHSWSKEEFIVPEISWSQCKCTFVIREIICSPQTIHIHASFDSSGTLCFPTNHLRFLVRLCTWTKLERGWEKTRHECKEPFRYNLSIVSGTRCIVMVLSRFIGISTLHLKNIVTICVPFNKQSSIMLVIMELSFNDKGSHLLSQEPGTICNWAFRSLVYVLGQILSAHDTGIFLRMPQLIRVETRTFNRVERGKTWEWTESVNSVMVNFSSPTSTKRPPMHMTIIIREIESWWEIPFKFISISDCSTPSPSYYSWHYHFHIFIV